MSKAISERGRIEEENYRKFIGEVAIEVLKDHMYFCELAMEFADTPGEEDAARERIGRAEQVIRDLKEHYIEEE